MQSAIGESIRQLRRQQGLTQTELGGEHFSKSYVSAVERGKIAPSSKALRFFAEQLGQPNDYLTATVQEAEYASTSSPFYTASSVDISRVQGEMFAILNVLLEETTDKEFPYPDTLPHLPEEIISLFPKENQARYFFYQGRVAQKQLDSLAALHALEQALSLSPPHYQPAILDEIGMNYYRSHSYQTALEYHKRALHMLQEYSAHTPTLLMLGIELHCGNAYRMLGAYKQALAHFEQAQQHQTVLSDLRTAIQLYTGLGYCTYAYMYQNATSLSSAAPPTIETLDRAFQRAISFLLQSRVLCQVSGNRVMETTVRLLHAMILLDLSTKRRQAAQQKAHITHEPLMTNCSNLLEEAAEQCRQVFMYWQEPLFDNNEPTSEITTALYTGLAYQIRVLTQRATLARLGTYDDTAQRERLQAAQLCQQVLDAFSERAILWQLLQDVLQPPVMTLSSYGQSLPHLRTDSTQEHMIASPLSQVEVYAAIGELCEELGQAARDENYAHDCYTRADYFFQMAMQIARSLRVEQNHDAGELLRRYQRNVGILEERIQVASFMAEETNKILLDILKEGLLHLQQPSLF